MRYNDTQVQPKKEERSKEPKQKPKPGEYDGTHLKESKDIPWRR